MKTIDKTLPIPLWIQMYDILKEQIDNNRYVPGQLLPAEVQLMKKHKVSRITIRQAMDQLKNENYVERIRGKGTLVVDRQKKEPNFKFSFYGNPGPVPKLFYKSEKRYAPKEVNDFFELESRMKLYYFVRYTIINEKIMVIYGHYLHPKIKLKMDPEYKGSFYELLSKNGYEINQTIEELEVRKMLNHEKEWFKVEEDQPIIIRKRRSLSNNRPIEFSITSNVAEGFKLTMFGK